MTNADRRFERELEARYDTEDPLAEGRRWRAEPSVQGWVSVRPVYSRWRDLWHWRAEPPVLGLVMGSVKPVYSRWRSLYGRPRGRGSNFYAGGYVFVRRRDGLVVEVASNPLLQPFYEDVLRDIGESATAEQIVSEIRARSGAVYEED